MILTMGKYFNAAFEVYTYAVWPSKQSESQFYPVANLHRRIKQLSLESKVL